MDTSWNMILSYLIALRLLFSCAIFYDAFPPCSFVHAVLSFLRATCTCPLSICLPSAFNRAGRHEPHPTVPSIPPVPSAIAGGWQAQNGAEQTIAARSTGDRALWGREAAGVTAVAKRSCLQGGNRRRCRTAKPWWISCSCRHQRWHNARCQRGWRRPRHHRSRGER